MSYLYVIAEPVHRKYDVLRARTEKPTASGTVGGPFKVPSLSVGVMIHTFDRQPPAWSIELERDTGYRKKRELRCLTGNLSSKAVLYNSYVPKVSMPYGTCPARELPSPLYMSGMDVAAAALPRCNRVFIVSSG